MAFETDWRVGSPMVWTHHGVVIEDPEQTVLAADPFTHLSYTWHSMPPELADHVGFGPDELARWDAEPRSTATFDIEDGDPFVKLTVTHQTSQPDSLVLSKVSGSWPMALAALKTLLETGTAPDEPDE